MHSTGYISRSRRLFDFFEKYWLASLAVLNLPTIAMFFAFVQRTDFDANVPFYRQHAFLLVFVFIPALLFSSFKLLADKYNSVSRVRAQLILSAMVRTLHDDMKYFSNEYLKLADDRSIQKIDELYRKAISNLLFSIRRLFIEIFGISEDGIGMSIILKGGDGNWFWLHSSNNQDELTLDMVTSDPHTTARIVLDEKKDMLFFPDKRVGIKNNQYVPSSRDENNMNIGSMICVNLTPSEGAKKCIGVLNISTYGQQLCPSNDVETIYKIKEIILSPLVARIRGYVVLHYS